MADYADMRLFALHGSHALGAEVARHLNVDPVAHEERDFEDGEHKARPLVGVRGRDVYVLHSLYGDAHHSANDKLCRLLFFCAACRDAGAGRVTALVPYLCYQRKDRRTKARDPVTTRYLAAMFEALNIDRVVALDVHNTAAFQNAFRCVSENLEARRPLVAHLEPLLGAGELVVLSPDAGGLKRAAAFRRALSEALRREVASAMMEKYRSRGEVGGEMLVGDLADRTAIVVDDLIASGGTMLRAARKAREQGARRVFAVATHGLFVDQANAVFADSAFDGVIVTNSVPAFRLRDPAARANLSVVDIAPLLAEAIACLHADGSLIELLGTET